MSQTMPGPPDTHRHKSKGPDNSTNISAWKSLDIIVLFKHESGNVPPPPLILAPDQNSPSKGIGKGFGNTTLAILNVISSDCASLAYSCSHPLQSGTGGIYLPFDRIISLLHCTHDHLQLFVRDRVWRSKQDMISFDPVNSSYARIDGHT